MLKLTEVSIEMYLIVTYRKFHPNTNKKYLLLSTTQNILQSDLIVGHKANTTSQQIQKKIEIIFLHSLRVPWIKGGYQQQQKAYKPMETEQLSTK